MNRLAVCILLVLGGCADRKALPPPHHTEGPVDVSAVDGIWETDKPAIRRLAYRLVSQLVQSRSKDRWTVPTEPVVIDEIRTTRDLGDDQYQELAKRREKLCRLTDVYYAPGWGVVHRETGQQAWILRITVRYTNNGRLYIYDYSFYHGLEAANGGGGLIKYDAKTRDFRIEESASHWCS